MSQSAVQKQMDLSPPRRKMPSLGNRWLLDVVRDFRDGKIKKPLHQREKVWSPEKDYQWIERLRHKRPKGQFLTYELYDQPGTEYLNDGLQRLLASLSYLNDPLSYGDSPDEAHRLLSSQAISVDFDVYDSHDEALSDFLYVNFGTDLTPYEMCRGILALMPGYELLWKGVIEEIHSIVSNNSHRIITTWTTQRPARHKHKRHDFSLYLRWARKIESLGFHNDVYVAKIRDIKTVIDGSVVEGDLRKYFENCSIDNVRNQMPYFRRCIEEITADILDARNKVNLPESSGIKEQVYRWLLDIGIWRGNNKIDVPRWKDFLFRFLDISRGDTRIQSPENPDQKLFVRSGRPSDRFREICDLIGSNLNDGRQSRSHGSRNGMLGFHDHHVSAFVYNGEGPIIPVTASENRSIGSQTEGGTTYDA